MKVFSIEDWFIYFLFLSREISAVLVYGSYRELFVEYNK